MSSGDNVTIKLIHEDSPFVEEVIKLADENKATLGFNPPPVYKGYAKSPGILIALVKNNFAGHLMWSMNSRTRYIRIWQLCIQPKYRGQKIARKLNNYLIQHANKEARGIRLECRADYGIDEMWINLGYSPIFEKPAKTEGCILKVWSIDFVAADYPSIFLSDYNNIKCSIDAYTLYQMIEEEGESTIQWLRSQFQICITDEIFVEIDQVYSSNSKTKKYLRNLLLSFDKPFSNSQDFQNNYEYLKESLETNTTNLSDIEIRHIARCISSDIFYFLTSKSNLLDLSNFIYSKTGVRVISREEAIDLKDNNPDELTYQPIRLESANYPISLQKIQQCLESNAPLQSPRRISQAEFITLYRLGFNLKIS